MTRLLVEHHGTAADDQTYDDLRNANLMTVIFDRKVGLPVELRILWLHAGALMAATSTAWASLALSSAGGRVGSASSLTSSAAAQHLETRPTCARC